MIKKKILQNFEKVSDYLEKISQNKKLNHYFKDVFHSFEKTYFE